MEQAIYVAGYPKSGTTWLTRLLGRALNSRTGGCMPQLDDTEPATEGLDRPGPWVVRKGHFALLDERGSEVVPREHVLSWRNLTHGRVAFIVRDPRDIAVSASYYWSSGRSRERNLAMFIEQMGTGKRFNLPPWQDYVGGWLERRFDFSLVLYEDLLSNTHGEAMRVLCEMGLSPSPQAVAKAVDLEQFSHRREDVETTQDRLVLGRKYHLKLMRKGIAGDWRNHFTPDLAELAHRFFGPAMLRLGYIKDEDWYKHGVLA